MHQSRRYAGERLAARDHSNRGGTSRTSPLRLDACHAAVRKAFEPHLTVWAEAAAYRTSDRNSVDDHGTDADGSRHVATGSSVTSSICIRGQVMN
ncbi:MAG TPA: hypothetical protein VEI57_01960 [Nitrospirota bacterium]|nr:hypothetical protein [Nitrospirota bacterium]